MHRHVAVVLCLGLIGVSACTGSASTSGPDADVAADATTTPVLGTVESTGAGADVGMSDVGFCDAISAIQSAEFELEETFGAAARQLFTDVQAAAPSEIADEVTTVIGALDAVAGLGISLDENDPVAVDAAFEILLDPDYTEANERLSEFTSDACGIDLEDADDGEVGLDDF